MKGGDKMNPIHKEGSNKSCSLDYFTYDFWDSLQYIFSIDIKFS